MVPRNKTHSRYTNEFNIFSLPVGTEKVDLVPAREANVKFTDMVVKFYEERIQWHAGHLVTSPISE